MTCSESPKPAILAQALSWVHTHGMSTPSPSSAFTPSGQTHMAKVESDRIIVRGKDLCGDLIGQQSFTAYFLFLLTGQTPTPQLVRVADATMVALAEHVERLGKP